MATLGQGNQVLNLILQQHTPQEQLGDILESGLLSDLLQGNIEGVNRNEFRKLLGLKPLSQKERRRDSEDPRVRYPWLRDRFRFATTNLRINDEISGMTGGFNARGVRSLEVDSIEMSVENCYSVVSQLIKKLGMDAELLDDEGKVVATLIQTSGLDGSAMQWAPRWDVAAEFGKVHFLLFYEFEDVDKIYVHLYEVRPVVISGDAEIHFDGNHFESRNRP